MKCPHCPQKDRRIAELEAELSRRSRGCHANAARADERSRLLALFLADTGLPFAAPAQRRHVHSLFTAAYPDECYTKTPPRWIDHRKTLNRIRAERQSIVVTCRALWYAFQRSTYYAEALRAKPQPCAQSQVI